MHEVLRGAIQNSKCASGDVIRCAKRIPATRPYFRQRCGGHAITGNIGAAKDAAATDFFRIPPNRVIEVDGQVSFESNTGQRRRL